ncbi:MAG: DUF6166 domain-containing protein [Hyphomicrobiaceae bacterium]
MKVYRGDRTIDGIVVTVDGRPLAERRDVKDICEDGFEWSFEGPAAAQLALAMLADHLADEAEAVRLHEAFMREVVANFANEWTYSSDDLDEAVATLRTML